MKNKIIWLVIILAVILLGVFASKNKTENNGGETLKIGAILNLTGTFADQGENSQKGIDLAVEEINNSGGILGRKIEVVYQDNDGDNPTGGLTALYNLTNQNVKLIVGPNLTPTANVIAPVVDKVDAVLIAPSVGSEKFAETSLRTFNVFPPNKFESFALAERLYEKGIRRIAIFGSQQEWEMDQANFVKQKFTELGGMVTSIQLPTVDNKDLRAESTKIKISNPEVVVFTNYGETAVAARRLRDLGVNVPFFSVLLFQPQIDQAQGALENTVFVTTDTSNPDFNHKFKSKYQKDPGFPANQAYDAVYLFAEAIKNSQSTNPQVVAESLSKIKEYKGVSGDMTFDADGNAHKTPLFYQVKNSKIVPVEN